MKKHTLTICFIFIGLCVYTQVNFRADLENNDPAPKDKVTAAEQRFSMHTEYLAKASREKDSLKIIYGNLYLFLDMIRIQSYDSSSDYIFEAIRIAEATKVLGWHGWTHYRSGMLYIRTNKEEQAVDAYSKSAALCRLAGDSLCLGESLEQLSAMHALLGRHQMADSIFQIAMPLLKKFGNDRQIATAINNYGGLVSMRGEPAKAIPFLEESIRLNNQNKSFRGEGKARNNLADAYRRLEMYETAISIYLNSVEFNISHGFQDNLVRNYMGLYLCYDALKEFKRSNEYLVKRYHLRDSLVDQQTTEKINELQIKYETKEREIELEKSQNSLLRVQGQNERFIYISLFLISLIGFLIWRYISKTRHDRKVIQQNHLNLKSTTNLLIHKNSQIITLKEKIDYITSQKFVHNEIVEDNLFDKRILTETDWSEFKMSFERSYPNYIMKIRRQFPDMTQAEERLFLLIKLGSTTKEIATILGISNESVKKNRHRLRKRIKLELDESLETFVKQFNLNLAFNKRGILYKTSKINVI